MTDYEKYRGKCKQFAEALCAANPNLTLVRGWYECPIWGSQQHWWCKDSATGTIHDPAKNQFPSKGLGQYTEYSKSIPCEYCGKDVQEKDMYHQEHHTYCSYICYGHDIGF